VAVPVVGLVVATVLEVLVLPVLGLEVLGLEVLELVLLEPLVLAAGALVELDVATVPEVRSTRPTLGATRVGIELEAAAVSEPLDVPLAPQAARPAVRRLHNRTLRISE
jgi:hypothetical protein